MTKALYAGQPDLARLRPILARTEGGGAVDPTAAAAGRKAG